MKWWLAGSKSPVFRLWIFSVFLFFSIFLALSCGPSGILWQQLWSGWSEFWSDPVMQAVMWDIRLPRVVLGACVGAGLAVSGAVLQAFFRNPLADPGLIGISSGAALGAVAFISLGGASWVALGTFGLPLSAFISGMAATTLIYLVARSQGRVMAVTFLLCGIAVNAMLGAVMSYLIFLSDDRALRSITFWLMGSLGFASWKEV
ncbi:MAG: iron chelate uptake ABC transporter family permease subunit, partial [Verrucomicrobiota bacterium]